MKRSRRLTSFLLSVTSDRKINDVEPGEDAGEDCPEDRAVSFPRANNGNRRSEAEAGMDGVVGDGCDREYSFVHSLDEVLRA